MKIRPEEDSQFLREQIITYLGNKRHLLNFIGEGISLVQSRLGDRLLRCFDAFSGSGIVSRYLKRFSSCLYTNDLEDYARVLNECYLANRAEVEAACLPERMAEFKQRVAESPSPSWITELYAPKDDNCIQPGERVFYTHRNAVFLDTARQLIAQMPDAVKPFFQAPLLYEASVHTNTSGVFKGFHKNAVGVGQFGGRGKNALSRICADMELELPIFSRFDCEYHVLQGDAGQVAASLPELDLAYVDPPYNQHPYGSNYFMLNLLLRNEAPKQYSPVSGIPRGWNRSPYNSKHEVEEAFLSMLKALPAKFVLISYNSEGFITPPRMDALLHGLGKVQVLDIDYATFRGCRNLRNRAIHVREFLYILEKK